MRVAVIVVFMSLLTTRSEASTSCMSKTEARQHFGTVYLYWHGPEHCWDATATRLHGVRHRVRHPGPTPHFVVPIPSPDLRRSANAMATDEPETELITVIPWVERWTDITQRTPAASVVVTDRKSDPAVTSRDAVMVIIAIILTLAVVEFLFGGMRWVGQLDTLIAFVSEQDNDR
jgi:hypothetical protein